MSSELGPALMAWDLGKRFREAKGKVTVALDGISISVARGTLVALVGPDGAGKTTFLRLAAGLMPPDAGRLEVLGIDVAASPQAVQDRLGYMPQKFGLYEDLSVEENLELYADLHDLPVAERAARYARLAEMTGLGPFRKRLAGRLSGGMKQKLGIACTLLSSPDLLLLDEPTVGVDPVSRRDLWSIVHSLVGPGKATVIVSTPYLGEAEAADQVLVLDQGHALAEGPPEAVTAEARGLSFRVRAPEGRSPRELQADLLASPGIVDAVPDAGFVRVVLDGGHPPTPAMRPVPPRFEDGFMILVRQAAGPRLPAVEAISTYVPESEGDVIVVRDLVKRFGAFTAVDHISFTVRAGEVFGLLGPNGAGKTTTFRMLCGLLRATGGTLEVGGVDVLTARASARQKIGYVAQKFALYGPLSVRQNLDFFARAYGLPRGRRNERIAWALHEFDLQGMDTTPAGRLPGGFKQRLAMAAALLHEPEILFLDEPTSGADALARRDFWRWITLLAERGVTVVVTTHFMDEAEYCDRFAILDQGRILAEGTPDEIRGHAAVAGAEATIEDAFVAIVEESRQQERPGAAEFAQ